MNIRMTKIEALIRLHEDPNNQVFEQVKNELVKIGDDAMSSLEKAAQKNCFGDEFNERVVSLINEIQRNVLKDELIQWINSEEKDLLLGSIIVSKHHDTYLEDSLVYDAIQSLRRAIWLEFNDYQTSFEQIKIFNRIFFGVFQFKCLNKESYSPEEIDISKVLESKQGAPLTIGLIYSIIAQSLDLPVYGVNLPNSFVLAFMDYNQSNFIINQQNDFGVLFYINPKALGDILDAREIDAFLSSRNLNPNRSHFEPCSNSSLIKRMIEDLMISFQHIGDDRKASDLNELINSI
ncbi:MAG: transglutaminase-like domain-containing protein [Crocinitomicaceae bacterium]|nr:transglutaminase-like domain-containing protein [Crocinitomicaceae bacterium]